MLEVLTTGKSNTSPEMGRSAAKERNMGLRVQIASLLSNEFNSNPLMILNDILWPAPPANLPLDATDVHVWAACLDAPPNVLSRCTDFLSADERQRAARFHFETHRNRYIIGRGTLRCILATTLNCPPDELLFTYGPQGKPELAGGFAESGLNFNVAHSDELALVAVTRIGPVGVDVEKIRPVSDVNDLVERFFSAREHAHFQTLHEEEKTSAFFNLWTRKEAWLKATGEGIGHLLNQVEVTFLPHEPARFLELPQLPGHHKDWVLRDLTPASGFIGAIALPGQRFSIYTYKFASSELL